MVSLIEIDADQGTYLLDVRNAIAYSNMKQYIDDNGFQLTYVDISGVDPAVNGDVFYNNKEIDYHATYRSNNIRRGTKTEADNTKNGQYAIVSQKTTPTLTRDLSTVNITSKLNEVSYHLHDSRNQQVAFKYLFMFLLVITAGNMAFNYKNLNMLHFVMLILLILYTIYYDYISHELLLNFTASMNEMQYASTTTKLMEYAKIIVISMLILFFPIIIYFSLGSIKSPIFSNLTSTSLSDTVDNVADTTSNTFNDLAETSTDAFNNAKNTTLSYANDFSENVSAVQSDLRDKIGDTVSSVENIRP